MKQISIFVLLACIITLTACSVKPSAELFCVSDKIAPPDTPAFALNASIPDDAEALTEEDGERVIYDQGDYKIFRETFRAESADAALRTVTGRDRKSLQVIRLSAYPQEEYRFTWTAAGETGDLACCGKLLYDGTTCYSICFECPAELENIYRSAFYHILSGAHLEPV